MTMTYPLSFQTIAKQITREDLFTDTKWNFQMGEFWSFQATTNFLNVLDAFSQSDIRTYL